jgi:hypothetical protein
MEGRTENFTPGDNFTPGGQLRPWGSKFAPRGEVKNGPLTRDHAAAQWDQAASLRKKERKKFNIFFAGKLDDIDVGFFCLLPSNRFFMCS